MVAVSPDPAAVLRLAGELCPDLVAGVDRAGGPPGLAALIAAVSPAEFAGLARRPPASPVLAVARRPYVDVGAVLRGGDGPLVVLDDPRHAGNAGAVVRVAAAAGARGVLVSGDLDPWGAPVLTAAAGLHFAVPVAALPAGGLAGGLAGVPYAAFDPDGATFRADSVSDDAVLVFGGERHGLGPEVLAGAASVWRLPMRPGVSSLNLATTVSAVLYARLLGRAADGGPGLGATGR